MALPILIGAGALILAGFGVKKIMDGNNSQETSEQVNDEAKTRLDSAKTDLENNIKDTAIHTNKLGEVKLKVYKESIIPFVDAFTLLKKIENSNFAKENQVSFPSMEEIKQRKQNYEKIVTEISASTLAGMGAAGLTLVALLGSSLLSKKDDKDSELSPVLKLSLVGASVLALGGSIYSIIQNNNKNEAIENLKDTKLNIEEVNLAIIQNDNLALQAQKITSTLINIDSYFKPLLEKLIALVKKDTNFNNYSKEEQEDVYKAYLHYETLNNLVNLNLEETCKQNMDDFANNVDEQLIILPTTEINPQ